jgi:two-component system, sensor histidine kinase PdtaS
MRKLFTAIILLTLCLNAKNEEIAKMYAIFRIDQREQFIQLLNKKNSDQQASLQNTGITQNYITGGGVLLCMIAGLTFYGFRNKQPSNKKLLAQLQEISLINQTLQLTVTEMGDLLIEKEWLLKEVNHRVKNNLHMIISLLESQAMFLENDALKAMQSSKHRIFSMSLIHQKLYQSADVKTIDMSVYLPELVNYLRASFDAGKYIHFNLEVDPIQLSIAQAIPLALVLNEAITNSVKYAFPGNRLGEISIKMLQTGESIELIISDNGVGIIKAMEDADIESLGLKLMRGLIEEINGQIEFENNNGTIITIVFKIDALIKNYSLLD